MIIKNSLLIWLIFSPLLIFTQQKGFNAGLILGFSGSSINGHGVVTSFTKPGITGGIFTGIDLNKKTGFQFEIKYVSKGTTGSSDVLGISLSQHASLNYIEFPLLIKLYDKDNSITVESGIAYARLISYEQYNVVPAKIIEPFDDDDISLIIGLDYFIKYKKRKSFPLYLNFRYTSSVLSITPYTWYMARSTFYMKGQYNRVFTITLNYKIS